MDGSFFTLFCYSHNSDVLLIVVDEVLNSPLLLSTSMRPSEMLFSVILLLDDTKCHIKFDH